MRAPDRLLCDATDSREGHGFGKGCPRKVVVESRREMADPAHSYSLHYCDLHADRAHQKTACVTKVDNREIP